MMAVIQNLLLGRGTDSMAQRKTHTGNVRVRQLAETMWFSTITR
jgi:hypothetical protein